MKILTITAYYPPYHSGGYELRCKDVLDRLAQRGHEIEIITNQVPQTLSNNNEPNIFRRFHLLDSSKSVLERLVRDFIDVKFLHEEIHSFKPDLIYLWHVVGFTRAIFPYLSELNIPIVYDEGGSGFCTCWAHGGSWYAWLENTGKSTFKRNIKAIVGKIVSKLSGNLIKSRWRWPENIKVYFNSEHNLKTTLNTGAPLKDSLVIHSGVNKNRFTFREKTTLHHPIQIISPGRLVPKKGHRDAILLLSQIVKKDLDAQLTIVGKHAAETYIQEILNLIKDLGLEDAVHVISMIEQNALAHLYHKADICFFPSHQQYGLSRIPLEAMACGCLVITYGNEGSSEVIQDKKNGFIVNQADFKTMTAIIQDLISDPATYQRIITNARQLIEEKYSMEAYVDKIEAFLLVTLSSAHLS